MRKVAYILLIATTILTACSKSGGNTPDPVAPKPTENKNAFKITKFSPDVSPIGVGQKFNLNTELSISDKPTIVYKISYSKDGGAKTVLSNNAATTYGVRIDEGQEGDYKYYLSVVNDDYNQDTTIDVKILASDFALGVWGNQKGVIEDAEDHIYTAKQSGLTGYWHDLPSSGHESIAYINAHGYNGFKYIFSGNKLIAGAGYLKYTSATHGNSYATFNGLSRTYSKLYEKDPSTNNWEWRNEPQHVIDQYTNSDDYVALADFVSVGNLSVTKVWGNDTDSTFININKPASGYVLVSVFRKTKDAK